MKYNNRSILIVEDNEDLLTLLKINLSDQGYDVSTAQDGVCGLDMYYKNKPDLVILDVMMPGMDGFDVCKAMRKDNAMVSILMLTAKAEEVDKVLGLEVGADDYMTKPFSIREFLARVKALFRRRDTSSNGGTEQNRVLVFDDLVLEPSKRKVTLNDTTVELTNKEYDLLFLFFSNPGKSYSREQLLNIVWGYSYEGYSHTVNSHINRLRSKIEKDPSNPHYIKTVWGIGYRFTDEEEIRNHA